MAVVIPLISRCRSFHDNRFSSLWKLGGPCIYASRLNKSQNGFNRINFLCWHAYREAGAADHFQAFTTFGDVAKCCKCRSETRIPSFSAQFRTLQNIYASALVARCPVSFLFELSPKGFSHSQLSKKRRHADPRRRSVSESVQGST